MFNRVLAVLMTSVLACLSVSAAAQDDGVRRSSSPVRPSLEFRAPEEPKQVEFDFGAGQGWLRSDGTYRLMARVQHNGLMCATYAVGVRFGSGAQGCNSPSSWSSPQIISTRRLCNNASAEFEGNGQDASLAAGFDAIGCAQLLIRCDGNCK